VAPSDIDIAERIVRLETKLDFIINQIEKLPPSPVCVAKHKELDEKFVEMERWRNRAIGVLIALNILFVIATEKIRAFLFPT
jgi:hypothetical protein